MITPEERQRIEAIREQSEVWEIYGDARQSVVDDVLWLLELVERLSNEVPTSSSESPSRLATRLPEAEAITEMAKAIHHVRFPRATHGEVYPASWNMAHAAYEALRSGNGVASDD